MGDIGREEEEIELVPEREVDPRKAPVKEPAPVPAQPQPVPA